MAEADAPTIGIDWPVGSGGKTTASNKAAFAAAARGAGDEALAKAIEGEKDWRFGYIPHLQALGRHLAGSTCLELAAAGLDKLYDTFVLRSEDGATRTLKEVSAAPVAQSFFQTEMVNGQSQTAIELSVPYQGRGLGEAEPGAVLKEMSDVG